MVCRVHLLKPGQQISKSDTDWKLHLYDVSDPVDDTLTPARRVGQNLSGLLCFFLVLSYLTFISACARFPYLLLLPFYLHLCLK